MPRRPCVCKLSGLTDLAGIRGGRGERPDRPWGMTASQTQLECRRLVEMIMRAFYEPKYFIIASNLLDMGEKGASETALAARVQLAKKVRSFFSRRYLASGLVPPPTPPCTRNSLSFRPDSSWMLEGSSESCILTASFIAGL
eukprot:1333230-Amorphochlora_amoeboformis.AAC.2